MREERGGRRRLIVGVVGLAVVVAAAAVVFFVVDGGEEGEPAPAGQTPPGRPTGDPGEPAEPDAELARQTLDYLAGEGAPALTMHRAAAGLGDRPAADRCRQVGATLDRDAPPDQLVLVIEGVPDEVLRDLLGDERASLGVTLTACVKGEQPTYERVAPLPDAVTLVQRRLDSLEAIR